MKNLILKLGKSILLATALLFAGTQSYAENISIQDMDKTNQVYKGPFRIYVPPKIIPGEKARKQDATLSLDSNYKVNKLNEMLQQRYRAMHPMGRKGINAAIVRPGFSWSSAAGYSDPEKDINMQQDMLGEIASVSKTFTAALILKLEEKGLLSTKDTVGKYFKGYKNLDPSITVEQLLRHESGLWDYLNDNPVGVWDVYQNQPDKEYNRMSVLESLGDPHFAPGEGFRYSNTNYLLLALIAEKAAGRDFSEILRQYILQPAGLQTTYAPGDKVPDSYTFAAGWVDNSYMVFGGNMASIPRLARETQSTGAAGMASTVADLAKWAHILYNGTALSAEQRQKMLTFVQHDQEQVGLGVFKFPFGNDTAIGHSGSFPGYATMMLYNPSDSTAIAVTINTNLGLSLYAPDLNAVLNGFYDVLYGTPRGKLNPVLESLTIKDENNNGVFEPGEKLNILPVFAEKSFDKSFSVNASVQFTADKSNESAVQELELSAFGYSAPEQGFQVKLPQNANTLPLTFKIAIPGQDTISLQYTVRIGTGNRAADLDNMSGRGIYARTSNTPAITDKFTLEFWMNPRSAGENQNGLAFSWNGVIAAGLINQGGLRLAALVVHPDSKQSIYVSAQTITANQWQHITLTYQPGTGIQYYINGKSAQILPLVVSDGADISVGDFGVRSAVIGNILGNSRFYASNAFDGAVDEIRLWNTVKSAQEIESGWRLGAVNISPSLAGYWTLDQQGEKMPDKSGVNSDGIIISGFTQGAPDIISSVNDMPTAQTEAELNIWPNPANDKLNIQASTSAIGTMHIAVNNAAGVIMYQSAMAVQPGQINIPLYITDMPQGTYSISLRMPDGTVAVQNITILR
jgi:D-alanyl-D-alanine carboxypeptidase